MFNNLYFSSTIKVEARVGTVGRLITKAMEDAYELAKSTNQTVELTANDKTFTIRPSMSNWDIAELLAIYYKD